MNKPHHVMLFKMLPHDNPFREPPFPLPAEVPMRPFSSRRQGSISRGSPRRRHARSPEV